MILYRPDLSKVDAVNNSWDKFSSFAEYDTFTCEWLSASQAGLERDRHDLGHWVVSQYFSRRRDHAGSGILDFERRDLDQRQIPCQIFAACDLRMRMRP